MLSKFFSILKVNILNKNTKFIYKKNKNLNKLLNILINKNIIINYYNLKNNLILVYVNILFMEPLKHLKLKNLNKRRKKKKNLPNYNIL
jgi:hypothetical protein